MLDLKTETDLQRLVNEQIEESLTLDYKASAALAKDSKSRDELCKDVSAFANSAGGQIIYGIEENNQKPLRVDGGSTVSREWIEQIIDSNVQPRIDGLIITPIRLSSGGAAFVLTVPQSNSRGAHQAPDKKYYKRQNFQSAPMEDYEIRDVMARSSKPDLNLSFHFDGMRDRADLKYHGDSDDHTPVGLTPVLSNVSNEPVLYAVVHIGLDDRIQVTNDDYEFAGVVRMHGIVHRVLRLRFNPNKSMPIFREMPMMLPNIGLCVPDNMIFNTNPYSIFYEIRAPGCAKDAKGGIYVEGGSVMRIQFDPAVYSRSTRTLG